MIRILIMFLLLVANFLQGQNAVKHCQFSSKYYKIYTSSIHDSREGNYNKSLEKINKIIKAYPKCPEAYIKKAGILYNLKEMDNAIDVLGFVITHFPDTESEVYFSRGFMYFEKKDFANAAKNFYQFLSYDSLKEERKDRAQLYYDTALFRDSLINNPVDFNPVLLSSEVNSGFSEYLPNLTLDGKSLVFTRRLNNQEDLYMSTIDSLGNFSYALSLETINTPANEGAHCISADGSLILFTGCDRDVLFRGCDLYFSILKDGNWTKPANIGKVINTPAWESQPWLSSDGKTLFFVSDRVGGFGGRDIWYTKKNERGIWEDPKNLGPEINTPKDDETPFLHPDGKTLYWRSNGRLGMGDFDIYLAKWDEDLQLWGEVLNLGYPINTEGNEGGLIVSLDGTQAYFATDIFSKKSETVKNLDLCYFELPPFAKANATTFIQVSVEDAKTGLPIIAQVELKDGKSNQLIYSENSKTTGKMITPILGNRKYIVHVFKEGYIFYNAHIDLDSLYTFENPYIYHIALQPLEQTEESEPIVLNNIFFRTGSFELLPESNPEIDMLYKLMKSDNRIQISISGHTDNVGQPEDNLILSLNRAISVKNALISMGIEPKRIKTEGMGQDQPIDTNMTPQGRKNNRRTEFKVKTL